MTHFDEHQQHFKIHISSTNLANKLIRGVLFVKFSFECST